VSTIVVVGGIRYAGQAIVRDAALRGHQVIAFSRSVPSEPVTGVEYQKGDATNMAEIEPLIVDAAVVIAALAPHGEMEGKVGDAYAQLAQAAAQAGARFFVVGGFTTLRPAQASSLQVWPHPRSWSKTPPGCMSCARRCTR
jgi:putative NADH-flavin reductase